MSGNDKVSIKFKDCQLAIWTPHILKLFYKILFNILFVEDSFENYNVCSNSSLFIILLIISLLHRIIRFIYVLCLLGSKKLFNACQV